MRIRASSGPGCAAARPNGSAPGSSIATVFSCRSGGRRASSSISRAASREQSSWAPKRSATLLGDADGEIEERLAHGEFVFLGLIDERAHFALDLSAHEAPLDRLRSPALAAAGIAEAAGCGSPICASSAAASARHEGALLALARAMMFWHSRHRFCGVCGAPTRSEEAGHMRRCTDPGCHTMHFPRTDPAVIMLVTDGDRALLGRNKNFVPGMYSTLAGFVEPGESLEDAVAREVREETAIEVGAVHYHSSQPWPFPANIMLGFYAEAPSSAITVDYGELEDARWFERDWLLSHHDDDNFRLPRRDSIARRLIEDWLAGSAPESLLSR